MDVREEFEKADSEVKALEATLRQLMEQHARAQVIRDFLQTFLEPDE